MPANPAPEEFRDLVAAVRAELAAADPDRYARLTRPRQRALPDAARSRPWCRNLVTIRQAATFMPYTYTTLRLYANRADAKRTAGKPVTVRDMPAPRTKGTDRVWEVLDLAVWVATADERKGKILLNDEQAQEILARWRSTRGLTLAERRAARATWPLLAKEFNVSVGLVKRVIYGEVPSDGRARGNPPPGNRDELAARTRDLVAEYGEDITAQQVAAILGIGFDLATQLLYEASPRRQRDRTVVPPPPPLPSKAGGVRPGPGEAGRRMWGEATHRTGWLRVSEVAKDWGLTVSAISTAINEGRILCVWRDGMRMVDGDRLRARKDGWTSPVDMDHPLAANGG